MKTAKFTDQYNELFEQIENRLKKLINWIGEPSNYVSEPCLKIPLENGNYMCDYDEIFYWSDKLCLIDSRGLQYSLYEIDFEMLCKITDKLSRINPNEAQERPLRHLSDSGINLSDFPNFHKSGSIKGMKKQFYGKGALLVQFGKYIYNVTSEPEIYFEHSEESEQDY